MTSESSNLNNNNQETKVNRLRKILSLEYTNRCIINYIYILIYFRIKRFIDEFLRKFFFSRT